LTDVCVVSAYDPIPKMPVLPQTITVYLGHPAFIMSPRIKLWRKEQIVKFTGYLSELIPDPMVEGEEPTATLTITPVKETV
jgi:hypothetical protein